MGSILASSPSRPFAAYLSRPLMSTLWYVFPNSLTEQIVLIQIPSWRAREREREAIVQKKRSEEERWKKWKAWKDGEMRRK